MTDSSTSSDTNQPHAADLIFGEEIEMTDGGFSFCPIQGYELEVDGTVYMYSEGGNLEIYLVGGELEEDQSIAELNDDLAAEFMENVGDYDLIQAGKDLIQGITGFLNQIQFSNGEEEGQGCCLICSPFLNQYFFILVIASSEYWQAEGDVLWRNLKSHTHFQPQYQPEIFEEDDQSHPDLAIEIFSEIGEQEDFYLTVEKGDASLLVAARSYEIGDAVTLLEMISPEDEPLYRFHPASGEFFSTFCDSPMKSTDGELCLFYPRTNQQSLHPGDYRFSFESASGNGLQEIQYIIRSGRALDTQKIDLNFYLAMKDGQFLNQSALDEFEQMVQQTLKKRIEAFNLLPGRIACVQPAPDELESFAAVNLDTDLPDCSYMIAETVSNDRALNIGLVDEIFEGDPPVPSRVTAISSGSPGMVFSHGSPHACILLHWPTFMNDPYALAEAIIQQLIVFSGIETKDTGQPESGSEITLNREIAWRLRRHPLFYDAD
jgi:hypothetical protein